MMNLSLPLFLCMLLVHVVKGLECDAMSSCKRQVLNDEDVVKCSGHSSCLLATFEPTIETAICPNLYSCGGAHIDVATDISCQSFESCQGAKLLQCSDTVECGSRQSCRYATIKTTNVYCDAINACASSNIDAESVYCNSQNSCATTVDWQLATITASKFVICGDQEACESSKIIAPVVSATSKQSVMNADIIANVVNLYGFQSALSANIVANAVVVAGYMAAQSATIESKANENLRVTCVGGYGLLVGKVSCLTPGSECELECQSKCCYRAQLLCLPGTGPGPNGDNTCKTTCLYQGFCATRVEVSMAIPVELNWNYKTQTWIWQCVSMVLALVLLAMQYSTCRKYYPNVESNKVIV